MCKNSYARKDPVAWNWEKEINAVKGYTLKFHILFVSVAAWSI